MLPAARRTIDHRWGGERLVGSGAWGRRAHWSVLPRWEVDPLVTQTNDTDRLEMFSDGVMAIAITLLAVEVDIHREADERLVHAIFEGWPLLLAYAISFLQVGIIWANHHNRFRLIARSDHTLLILNTLFLMGVAFIPVSTRILGEHILGTGDDFRAAAALYAGNLAFTAFWFTFLWLHASRRLIDNDLEPAKIGAMDRRFVVGAVLYFITFGIAFWSPILSLTVLAILALRFLIPERKTQ
jgi:uncharacterized membrane protein